MHSFLLQYKPLKHDFNLVIINIYNIRKKNDKEYIKPQTWEKMFNIRVFEL